MKLSMWTLCDYLLKRNFAVEEYISEGLPNISLIRQNNVRTYTEGYAEVFYEGSSVVVANGMDRLTVKGTTMADVINALGEALEMYTQWERNLYECILRRGSLQEMLDIAKEVFKRPMFIKNDATRTLAITHGYSTDVHPYWDKLEVTNQKVTDYEIVSAVSSDPEYKVAFTEKYPSIRSSPAYGAMVLHANIFLNERRVAEVVALENGIAFNNGDIHIMHVFAELIEKYVKSDSHIFQTASDVTISLKSLLETGRIEKEQYHNIKKYMGIEDGDEMCVIVVSCADRLDSPILSALREKLETQLKDSAVIHYGNQIVILKLMKKLRYSEMIEDFKHRIPREGFCWGTSYEFTKIQDMPLFYRQCCNMIEDGVFETKSYVTCYEMASQMISELCNENDMARTFVHPDLLRLESCDLRENTEYCETLFYYLLCGGNFTDASKIMNLHRNTLIYRVNKIREIAQSNLDDISNRKLLLYSYLLLNKDY